MKTSPEANNSCQCYQNDNINNDVFVFDAHAASRLIVSINGKFMVFIVVKQQYFVRGQQKKARIKTLNKDGNIEVKWIFEYTHVYCFGM